MEQKMYMISDAAKQVEVESHVLRYWEDELELPIKRNKLGHRYYTVDDVNRLKRVKSMKEQGFQLKAIRRALKEEIQEEEKKNAGAAEGKTDVEKEDVTPKTVGSKQENPVYAEKDMPDGTPLQNTQKEMYPAAQPFYTVKEQDTSHKEDKTYRLQILLKNMMVEAIQEESEKFCMQIKESVLKELDYQFRMQEEKEEQRELERIKREEEHYKKIDEMIREKVEKKEKRKKHSFF